MVEIVFNCSTRDQIITLEQLENKALKSTDNLEMVYFCEQSISLHDINALHHSYTIGGHNWFQFTEGSVVNHQESYKYPHPIRSQTFSTHRKDIGAVEIHQVRKLFIIIQPCTLIHLFCYSYLAPYWEPVCFSHGYAVVAPLGNVRLKRVSLSSKGSVSALTLRIPRGRGVWWNDQER